MEDVEHDAVAVGAHAIEKSAIVAEVEVVERSQRHQLGRLVQTTEVPPERTALQPTAEGGNAFRYRLECLLKQHGVNVVGKGDINTV